MPERDSQERLRRTPSGTGATATGGIGSLQLILWSLWTIAVLRRSYLQIRPALLSEAPVDLVGLVVHCMLVGMIGLVVITVIEMWLEPWRFLPDGDD